MGVCWGAQELIREFGGFCELGELCKIREFHKFRDRCSGSNCTICCQGLRKLYWVSFVLCIIIIITTTSITATITTIIIIPSFVVLLSCLYLNPQVLLFVHSLPHPTAVGNSEKVAVWSYLPAVGLN